MLSYSTKVVSNPVSCLTMLKMQLKAILTFQKNALSFNLVPLICFFFLLASSLEAKLTPRENIFKNEDETLTWRIDQANKFLNKAISGNNNNNNNNNEQNRLNDDLKSINDLIKDKIWIKKNY